MVETNVRIVKGAATLAVPVRRARVVATQERPDLLELACVRLRQRHQLAAAPIPNDPANLLVATTSRIPEVVCAEESWELRVDDAGELPLLQFDTDLGREVLPLIVERAALQAIV